jgi:hypothetical protein
MSELKTALSAPEDADVESYLTGLWDDSHDPRLADVSRVQRYYVEHGKAAPKAIAA